jgi:hypothetical protein
VTGANICRMISRCFSQTGAESRHTLITSWSGCINRKYTHRVVDGHPDRTPPGLCPGSRPTVHDSSTASLAGFPIGPSFVRVRHLRRRSHLGCFRVGEPSNTKQPSIAGRRRVARHFSKMRVWQGGTGVETIQWSLMCHPRFVLVCCLSATLKTMSKPSLQVATQAAKKMLGRWDLNDAHSPHQSQ